MSAEESDWLGALWFAATVAALVVLFAAASGCGSTDRASHGAAGRCGSG